MEYKFIVHLTEDLEQHEATIRKILAFDIPFNGDEEEHFKLCEEWLNFKRFLHPGEAIDYYERTKEFPDLKIQDIDFTEIKNKKIPAKYRQNISGIFELEYLLNVLNKYNDKDRHCIFLPYSGKLDDRLIVEALHKTGWEDKTIVKQIIEITNTRLMKDEQAQLELRLKENLKELAKIYFRKLNDGERKRLEASTNNIYVDWKNYTVDYNGYDFKLRNMLVGFGDINNMTPTNISNIIKTLLDDSLVKVEFLGWWKEGEECNKLLKQYFSDPQYLIYLRRINLKAVDIILELMKFKEDEVFEIDDRISLIERNQLYEIGTELTNNKIRKNEAFFDKLIARRVVIGLSKLYASPNEDILFQQSVTTIIRGYTNPVSELSDLLNKAVSEYLGLERSKKRAILYSGKILTEELYFLNTFISNGKIKCLRSFLNDYEPPIDLINGFTYEYGSYFLDLTAFNDFIFQFQVQKPERLKQLIEEIKSNLKIDDMYYGVADILERTTPLFL